MVEIAFILIHITGKHNRENYNNKEIMMGEIKDEMVTKVMMEVKVQMTSSKKLGNHNGRCSVVSEGNKSTRKMNE